MTHSLLSRIAVASVAVVAATAPTLVRAQAPMTVRGIAYDSLHGAPLSGAFIGIAGSSRTTVSDDRGRFRFDSVVPGTYKFVMQDDVFDSIGLSGATTLASIRTGDDTVTISVPSFAALWKATCRTAKPPTGGALIFGTVRQTSGQRPAAGVKVSATWLNPADDGAQPVPREDLFAGGVGISRAPSLIAEDYDRKRADINAEVKKGAMSQIEKDHAMTVLNTITERTMIQYSGAANQNTYRQPAPLDRAGWRLDVTSDSTGYYSLCGVPTTTPLQLKAATSSTASEIMILMPFDKSRVARRDLVLGQRPDSVPHSPKSEW